MPATFDLTPELERERFMASLREAEAEAERDGYVTVEKALADIEDIISAAETSKAS